MSDVLIASGYAPGSIGRVAELHGAYYHDHWGFGLFFEAKVAKELAVFFEQYEPARDCFWSLSRDSRLEGCLAIEGAGADEAAHLRWFIVSKPLQGQGWGRRLLASAVDFCRQAGCRRIYLWTFEGLHPARHLYEAFGFELIREQAGSGWGTTVREQRFECLLK